VVRNLLTDGDLHQVSSRRFGEGGGGPDSAVVVLNPSSVVFAAASGLRASLGSLDRWTPCAPERASGRLWACARAPRGVRTDAVLENATPLASDSALPGTRGRARAAGSASSIMKICGASAEVDSQSRQLSLARSDARERDRETRKSK
jgi:hypothetical protein